MQWYFVTCTSLSPYAMAGEQTRIMIGGPGINDIRCSTVYAFPNEGLEHMKRIASAIGINSGREITRKEGYLPELSEGHAEFGELTFQKGPVARKITKVIPKDMDAGQGLNGNCGMD